MRYFFALIISVLIHTVSFAQTEIPNEINVYSSLPYGISSTEACKHVLNLYQQKYNAKITMFIKPGAEGIPNVTEAFNSKGFNLICGGITDMAFNPVKFPNYKYIFDELRFASVITKGALSFYSGPKSPYNDLLHLLSQKKSVTVGYHRENQRAMAEPAFRNVDVNWVRYKIPTDAITQVVDGSLDVYVSLGSFSELVRAGRLKTLGFLNGDHTIQGRDLTENYPDAKNLPVMIGFLSFTSKTTDEQSAEFNRRIHSLIKENAADIVKIFSTYDLVIYLPTQQESSRFIKNWRDLAKK